MKVRSHRLEIFKNLFHSVAEEMAQLCASRFSPNIKERRDYSAQCSTALGKSSPWAITCPSTWDRCPCTGGCRYGALKLEPGDVAAANDRTLGEDHCPT